MNILELYYVCHNVCMKSHHYDTAYTMFELAYSNVQISENIKYDITNTEFF